MSATTKPRLTPEQRRALDQIKTRGGAYLQGHSGDQHFAKRTLTILVERGLAEWDDRQGWPCAVAPGANARRRGLADAATEKAARERAEKIAALAADPTALATYLVDLEERLNARITDHRHIGSSGSVI